MRKLSIGLGINAMPINFKTIYFTCTFLGIQSIPNKTENYFLEITANIKNIK